MKSTETIDKIVKGGKTYQIAEELSEIMNENIKQVFTEEEAFTELSMIEAQEGLKEVVVQKQDVGRLMGSLDVRKAIGPDGVSGWTLRECKDQLMQPIWKVITSSIEEGRVPKEWKRANIVSIYRGGKKTDPSNHRPVSLTSVVSKFCEILIKEKWVRYLEDNRVITNRQYRFRQGKSCVTNLLSFYARVTEGIDN